MQPRRGRRSTLACCQGGTIPGARQKLNGQDAQPKGGNRQSCLRQGEDKGIQSAAFAAGGKHPQGDCQEQRKNRGGYSQGDGNRDGRGHQLGDGITLAEGDGIAEIPLQNPCQPAEVLDCHRPVEAKLGTDQLNVLVFKDTQAGKPTTVSW